MNFFELLFLKKHVSWVSVFVLILATWSCSAKSEHKERAPATEISVANAEYVGSEKCKACHWREHDSWKHTLHSKFLQRADDTTVIADFERNNTLSVTVTGEAPKLAGMEATTTMHKKGDKYYVTTTGPDWESHDYEITNVIGINLRQNYLTKFPNGELHVLPVEWDASTGKWLDFYGLETNYPGDGNYWSDSARLWQFKCGSCHATGLKTGYDPETNSFSTTWVDLGIGCEACHGPGSNHIKAAKEIFDKEKETIVNPAKLPWRLRAMVCGQCHNWGYSTAEISPTRDGFPKRYAYAYGYLPGKSLNLYYVENPEDDRKHHQQYNEWQASAHSGAGIMCTTCHGVHEEGAHKSPNKSQTRVTGDMLCTKCHKTIRQRSAHRIHTFGSCVACHMPQTAGHERSHKFQFISPEKSLLAGGVDKQPNSCSGCHYHKETPLKNLVEFLDAAKKADMPKPYFVHGSQNEEKDEEEDGGR
jgi:predicted CXXCH cytochrome family protein